MTKKLTYKQEAFALKYAECRSASEAYRHAYKSDVISNKSIATKGYNIKNKAHVRKRISELLHSKVDDNKELIDGLMQLNKLLLDANKNTLQAIDTVLSIVEELGNRLSIANEELDKVRKC